MQGSTHISQTRDNYPRWDVGFFRKSFFMGNAPQVLQLKINYEKTVSTHNE